MQLGVPMAKRPPELAEDLVRYPAEEEGHKEEADIQEEEAADKWVGVTVGEGEEGVDDKEHERTELDLVKDGKGAGEIDLPHSRDHRVRPQEGGQQRVLGPGVVLHTHIHRQQRPPRHRQLVRHLHCIPAHSPRQ